MAKTGIKSIFYLRTGGNFASPTFTAVSLVGDLAVAAQWNYAEAATRETPVVRGARTTLPLNVTGKVRVEDTDTSYVALDNAFHNSLATVDVMILNGSQNTNAVTGFRYEAELVNWSEDQALGNVLFKDVEFRPALSTNMPKRVVVSSGAPVFTDIV